MRKAHFVGWFVCLESMMLAGCGGSAPPPVPPPPPPMQSVAAAQVEAPRDPATVEAELKTRAAEFEAAWNQHDAKILASFFAADATLINPVGVSAKGRADVEKVIASDLAMFIRGATTKFTLISVRALGSDAAYFDGVHEVSGLKTPDGQTLPPVKLAVAATARKIDGKWMILDARPHTYFPAPYKQPEPDPAKVATNVYKPLFENHRVRAFDVTFAKGAKVVTHSHPDHVAVVVTGGKLRITGADNKSADLDLKQGQAVFLPAQTHSAENIGKGELKLVVIELK